MRSLTSSLPTCPVFAALSGWDGRYETGSAGALAFELVVFRLIERLVPRSDRAMLGAVRHGLELLAERLDHTPRDRVEAALRAALAIPPGVSPVWRLGRRESFASRASAGPDTRDRPSLGRRRAGIDWGWPGSNETLMKAAHPPVGGRHATGFGSNARYIFDLSDPDANYLVILGGQDGVPGSTAFLDQAELFRRGAFIKVPLTPDTARTAFGTLRG